MRVTCQRDATAFATLDAAWRDLHARSATATFFNSVDYARLWWDHWGQPGALQVWTVWEGDALLGVAPLYETTDEAGGPVLHLLGGTEISDYLDVVAAPGQEAAVVAALLAGWADAPCTCPVDLRALPHASPAREAFLRLAPDHGFVATATRDAVCPILSLPDSWEAYLAQLPGKQRRELRRKLRKAGQDELVSWYRVPSPLVEEEMAHFFRLHARSDPLKAAFMTDAMRAFFLDLARTLARQGTLDLCFLLVNGRRAAVSLNFLFRDMVLLYNSGFDESQSDALSPGWLLLCYHIEYAIAQGHRAYDFLQGDEAYKFRFGARAEPVHRVRLTRGERSRSPGDET